MSIDPRFLAEAKKLELEVEPVDARAVEQLIREVYATPPDIVQLARQAMRSGPVN